MFNRTYTYTFIYIYLYLYLYLRGIPIPVPILNLYLYLYLRSYVYTVPIPTVYLSTSYTLYLYLYSTSTNTYLYVHIPIIVPLQYLFLSHTVPMTRLYLLLYSVYLVVYTFQLHLRAVFLYKYIYIGQYVKLYAVCDAMADKLSPLSRFHTWSGFLFCTNYHIHYIIMEIAVFYDRNMHWNW
jgi:hypothetical protein